MTASPKINGYKIIEEVGSGGLGRVFRAIDLRTGQTVAVKVLHDKFVKSKKFLGIFHRELLIVSRLQHKNIVNYLDGNFNPPNCYIVTEFIEGFSLYALIKKCGRLPPLVALSVAIDILQGIDYLHLHDTIHSDLSAPNVLISRDGRVLVTDFGLSCEQDIEDYKNYMVGTPGYYSPEHVTEAAITPQTDLYCIGLLLYEMLCGSKAVPASQDRRVVLKGMRHIAFGNIRASERSMQWLLRKVLKNCLHPSISRRVPNSENLMLALFAILRKYDIRYTRMAVLQFLSERGLTTEEFKSPSQNIHRGFVP